MQSSKATGWKIAWTAAPAIAATIPQPFPYIAGAMNQNTHQAGGVQSASQPTSYVDEKVFAAEMKAAEAKADSKFSQLMGELRLFGVKLDNVAKDVGDLKGEVSALDAKITSTKSTIIATVIGAAIGIVGLTFAAVAIFQSGMGLSATAYQAGMSAMEARKP